MHSLLNSGGVYYYKIEGIKNGETFNTITNQLNKTDVLLISPEYHLIWWGLLEIRSFKSQRRISVSIESGMTVSWIGEQAILIVLFPR